MSSSLTAPTSTTASSSSCLSRGVRATGVWAMGVRGHPPGRQSPREQSAPPGQQSPLVEVIACGALAGHVREIVARRGWPVAVRSLPAILHNRPQKITLWAERAVVSAQNSGHKVALAYADCGTYVLTDFLLRSFRRSVLVELGLDRYPELWSDYFGHYRRLVWLAQQPTPALAAEAERI